MSIRRLLVTYAVVFAVSGSVANAVPCSQAIDRLQAQFDAKLALTAAAGPSGRESITATLSHQPTPNSIVATEAKLGKISRETVRAVEEAMARAREASRGADKSACVPALADARPMLGEL
jgi:hypothetical protein